MFLRPKKEKNQWAVAVQHQTPHFMVCPLWSDQQHAINGVIFLSHWLPTTSGTLKKGSTAEFATEYAFIIYLRAPPWITVLSLLRKDGELAKHKNTPAVATYHKDVAQKK